MISSVQFSCFWLFVSPWAAAQQASLSITNPQSLLKLLSIQSVMPSNHLIFCHSFLFLPSIFPSIRVFSKESVSQIRWPKYWSFSFSISPSNEYWELISLRIDWLDFLTVQGTLKSVLQHHSSKASILQRSASFMVQLSHPYMTTGKTIALSRQTFVQRWLERLCHNTENHSQPSVDARTPVSRVIAVPDKGCLHWGMTSIPFLLQHQLLWWLTRCKTAWIPASWS